MSNAIVRMMQGRPGGGSSVQVELEECIAMHDTEQATHIFEHRGLNCTYLLKNVEIRNSGLIYADYGMLKDTGVFGGWFSLLRPDEGAQPGLFVPSSGRLSVYPKRYARDLRHRWKEATFVQHYGRQVA